MAKRDKHREATDPSGALSIFQRVVKEYPDTEAAGFARFRCAEALVQMGQCNAALALAQSVIDSNPKTLPAAWAQYAVGQALLKKGEEYGGVIALRRVKEHLPDRLDISPLSEARRILGDWSFGVVNEGDCVRRTFTCRNAGDADLVVSGIQPSCEACLVPVEEPQTIAPGCSAQTGVVLTTTSQRLAMTKKPYVASNDPISPVVTGLCPACSVTLCSPQSELWRSATSQ